MSVVVKDSGHGRWFGGDRAGVIASKLGSYKLVSLLSHAVISLRQGDPVAHQFFALFQVLFAELSIDRALQLDIYAVLGVTDGDVFQGAVRDQKSAGFIQLLQYLCVVAL